MIRDERRSARLLFADELADGAVGDSALAGIELEEAVRATRVPSAATRAFQVRALARGRLGYEHDVVEPMLAARGAVLGERAAGGPPRFLLRVDGFPHHLAWDEPDRYGTERFARAAEVLRAAEVPWLCPVLPRVPQHPLDPGQSAWRPHSDAEREALVGLRHDGVAFALHGLDHRARGVRGRGGKHAELAGLRAKALADRIDAGLGALRETALHAPALVAPWDAFDAEQYPLLAERFDVIAGGPGSLRRLGFHRTPLWRGDAVYLPAYPPLHGSAAGMLETVDRLRAREARLWIPLAIDWGREAEDDFAGLQRLATRLHGHAGSWHDFFAAVDLSRIGP